MLRPGYLSDVTVGVTTFLRHGYLMDCLKSLAAALPECPVLVTDDGKITPERSTDIHNALAGNVNSRHVTMPFDSGLSAKRNLCVQGCRTKYLLVSHDDSDFHNARAGVLNMKDILEQRPDVDAACGTMEGRPYEGTIDYVRGSHWNEDHSAKGPEERVGNCVFYRVDIAHNYIMAKPSLLAEIPWDESLKTAEHEEWFMCLKEAGKKVVYVPSAVIREMPFDAAKEDPEYRDYRYVRIKNYHHLWLRRREIRNFKGTPFLLSP